EVPAVDAKYTLERREGINMLWVRMPFYAQAHSKQRILNWLISSWRLSGLRKAISEKADVILYSSPSLLGDLGAERLARNIGAKLLFEVRDIWPLTLCELGGVSVSHPFIRLLQWVECRAYRNADMVLSNLKYAWQHMEKHGLDKKKFHWLPNG